MEVEEEVAYVLFGHDGGEEETNRSSARRSWGFKFRTAASSNRQRWRQGRGSRGAALPLTCGPIDPRPCRPTDVWPDEIRTHVSCVQANGWGGPVGKENGDLGGSRAHWLAFRALGFEKEENFLGTWAQDA